MRETGVIVSSQGEIVQIQINKGERCDGCHGCISLGTGFMLVEARNATSASTGDIVDVEIDPRRVIGHSVLLFIFPITMMIAGYFVSMKLFSGNGQGSENPGILGSLAGFILALFILKTVDNYWGRSNKSSAIVVGLAAMSQGSCVSIPLEK
jgi:positive regulator of sigma E activity